MDFVKEVFLDEVKYIFDENQIYRGNVKNNLSNKFHKKMPKGANLRDLKNNKYHQINWETPYYEDTIIDFAKNVDKIKPIIDIGCGDGRFIDTLINLGFKKIVCLDSDYRLLESLHSYSINRGYRSNLLLIHSDADELPFKNNIFSLVLAIGVLYYLNEKEKGVLKKINSLLETDGILILGNPDIEGMIFRSLIFESLESSLDVFEKRCFTEGKEDKSFKFSVRSMNEQVYMLKETNFEVIDKQNITMFHNLLRILLVKEYINENQIRDNEDRLKKMFDFLHIEGKLAKHIIWKCIKKNE